MALFSRFRTSSLHHHCRYFSTASILSADSKTPLTSKQKTRATLSLLKAEQDPGRVVDICRAATLTPESHLDRIAFSVAISTLSKSNHFSFISQLLEELKTRPDLRTERFGAHAIILYGQANMLDHAVSTFKELNEEGICRSVKSLNALLFACILAKDYKEVKRIYLEFPKIYGINPNLETYNTMIKAFCESGSSSSAYSLLAEMDRKGLKPNAKTFGLLIAGFYKEEKEEDVWKVLKMMEGHGVRIGVSTYNIRIQSLCKLNKSADAKELFDVMLSMGIKPNSVTYSHLIHGFCNESKLEEAKKLFKSMVNRGYQPDSDCYFTLVYYLCQGGDFETAFSVCKESMEKGWVPQFTTMKSLVNGLASISKVEEARELIGKMKERFSKNADMWNEIETGLPQ